MCEVLWTQNSVRNDTGTFFMFAGRGPKSSYLLLHKDTGVGIRQESSRNQSYHTIGYGEIEISSKVFLTDNVISDLEAPFVRKYKRERMVGT